MKIKNLLKRELEIVVETKDLSNVFYTNLSNCKILPRTEVDLTVYFSPKLSGNYSSELLIYDKNQELLEVCTLKGENTSELIESDALEIYFQPVPINVSTKESIILTHANYKKAPILNWKILDQENVARFFKVHFLNENQISIGQKR